MKPPKTYDVSPPKTEGQRLLGAVSGTLDEIAATIGGGCSKASVSRWRSGAKVPGPVARAAIAYVYPEIGAETWAMLPTTGRIDRGVARAHGLTIGGTPDQRVSGARDVDEGEGDDDERDPKPENVPKKAPTLIEQAERQLARAIKDIDAPGILLAERTRARREVVTMMRDIARMKAAEESLQADVVKRSPFFRAATRELVSILRAFPDAARAVAARFGEIEAMDDARPVQGALDEEDEER